MIDSRLDATDPLCPDDIVDDTPRSSGEGPDEESPPPLMTALSSSEELVLSGTIHDSPWRHDPPKCSGTLSESTVANSSSTVEDALRTPLLSPPRRRAASPPTVRAVAEASSSNSSSSAIPYIGTRQFQYLRMVVALGLVCDVFFGLLLLHDGIQLMALPRRGKATILVVRISVALLLGLWGTLLLLRFCASLVALFVCSAHPRTGGGCCGRLSRCCYESRRYLLAWTARRIMPVLVAFYLLGGALVFGDVLLMYATTDSNIYHNNTANPGTKPLWYRWCQSLGHAGFYGTNVSLRADLPLWGHVMRYLHQHPTFYIRYLWWICCLLAVLEFIRARCTDQYYRLLTLYDDYIEWGDAADAHPLTIPPINGLSTVGPSTRRPSSARPWWWSASSGQLPTERGDSILAQDEANPPPWWWMFRHGQYRKQRRRRQRLGPVPAQETLPWMHPGGDNDDDDEFCSVQEEWASRCEDDPHWWSREEEEINLRPTAATASRERYSVARSIGSSHSSTSSRQANEQFQDARQTLDEDPLRPSVATTTWWASDDANSRPHGLSEAGNNTSFLSSWFTW
jgi:hypothetical protein